MSVISQTTIKSSILAEGTKYDVQKQFLSLVNEEINSPVSIPASINRYLSVLKYARTKCDYVLGDKLYMVPSDMNLKIDGIEDYNNLIVIADRTLHTELI